MRSLHFGFIILLVAGCVAPDGPVAPHQSLSGGTAKQVSDAAHNRGRAHFFFLAPMVPNPTPTGVFDGSVNTEVQICQWTSGCDLVVAQFTRTSGTGNQTIRVDDAGELYVVNWNTRECTAGPCTLDPAKTYRLRVIAGGIELGFADLDVVANGSLLKNVETGAFIGLVDGRTLPVKFRIEHGAIAVIAGSGGASSVYPAFGSTVVTEDGDVRLEIPPGALPGVNPVQISVAPPIDAPPDRFLIPGTAVELGPDGSQFATPVKLTVAYDPSLIPSGRPEESLRLYLKTGQSWELVVGSTVDPITNTVSGQLSHFSTYSVQSMRRLAFFLHDQGPMFTMYEDGSGLTNLRAHTDELPGPSLTHWGNFPTWSVDGSRLVYGDINTSSLRVLDAENVEPPHEEWGIGDWEVFIGQGYPDWHPTGSEVVHAPGGGGALIVAPPRSGNSYGYGAFYRDGNPLWTPRWSQDGTRIYFASNRGGEFDIYSVDFNGGDLTRHSFTPDRWEALGPWNRARTKYLLLTWTSDSYEINVVDAATGVETQVVSGLPHYARCYDNIGPLPAWMPGENRIMYVESDCDAPDGGRYVSIDLNGNNPIVLLTAQRVWSEFGSLSGTRRLSSGANWEP
jgi:hypothetical protein